MFDQNARAPALGLLLTGRASTLPPQVGVMYFIGAGFWTIESLWCMWVYKLVYRSFRGQGMTAAQVGRAGQRPLLSIEGMTHGVPGASLQGVSRRRVWLGIAWLGLSRGLRRPWTSRGSPWRAGRGSYTLAGAAACVG